MPIPREIVTRSFQRILGRAPESEDVIASHMTLANEAELDAVLLNSAEYTRRNPRPRPTAAPATKSTSPKAPRPAHRATASDLRITLLGNCQVQGLGELLQALLVRADVAWYQLGSVLAEDLATGKQDARLKGSDLIFLHPDGKLGPLFKSRFAHLADRVRLLPRISFQAFHPDSDYIYLPGGSHLKGPMDDYHSGIVFHAWSSGLSSNDAIKLFCGDVYLALGYFDQWTAAVQSLSDEGSVTGLPLEHLMDRWTRQGAWMHSINHPHIYPLADVMKAALRREGIEAAWGLTSIVRDQLVDGPVWPVYPEIAARLGLQDGHYRFKQATQPDGRWHAMELDEFIEKSYRTYASHPRSDLQYGRVPSPRLRELAKLLGTSTKTTAAAASPTRLPVHPYAGLPDHQFWRRAVQQTPTAEVDPVVRSNLQITPTDKVATAGSCFAQHISRTLQRNGFHYFVTEDGGSLSPEEMNARNYGVFSARFGNLYTARQLLQLFDQAYGRFSPVEQAWQRKDGRWVDPFRPQIEPDGFDDLPAVTIARHAHLAAVRHMFEQLDVLVFTLGLTEGWHSRIDGAVYPLAPGVAGGTLDPARYAFVNFSVTEVTTDLRSFAARLRGVNPSARVVLTVSPVPLIATYEPRHVLTSTTYSKAVLRAAAHEVCLSEPGWEYFPSYEIITGPHARGAYYDEDLRSIRPEGVAHVMRLFLRHCAAGNDSNAAASPQRASDEAFQRELSQRNSAIRDVVCDEEALDISARKGD